MEWVVGSILPIWLGAASVNQRAPSGPTVIVYGAELAVGVANSLMEWVVGLISPIRPTLSVNQRLPSDPAVIPPGIRRPSAGRIS